MTNNEQQLLKELDIDQILITESSKDIIYISKNKNRIKNLSVFDFNRLLSTFHLNPNDEKQRKVNLIYLCLLQFHGLIRYIHFNEFTEEDIKKISFFIKHIYIKKGKYLFRQGDKAKALYGLIKGKCAVREINCNDYTKKFLYEKDKDINLKNDIFDKKIIPFEVFMSDCEDESEEEEEIKVKKKSIANSKLEKEFLPMDEKKFEIIQKKKLKRLEQKTEEDIDMEIDFKVKRQLKRKIDLTIRLNKTTFKKKKKKNPTIKRLQFNQTPKNIENNLDDFIKEFEEEKFSFQKGMCFGEWGLIYSIPRTTSIYIKENSDLFYLEKIYFDKLLTDIFQRADANKVNFLSKTLPIFKQGIKVGHILTKIIPTFFEKQSLVYTPFDNANFLYLVYQGECSSIILPYAKEKKDYFEKIRNAKIISKFQKGAIVGFESCFEGKNNYKSGLLITKEYTTLMKIDINYILDFFPNFKKAIMEIYNEEIKVHNQIDESVKFALENCSYYEKMKREDVNKTRINNMFKLKKKIIPKNDLKILNTQNDKDIFIKRIKTHQNFTVKKTDIKKTPLIKSNTKLGITIQSNINIQPQFINSERNSFTTTHNNNINSSISNFNYDQYNTRLSNPLNSPLHSFNNKKYNKSLFNTSNSINLKVNNNESMSDNKKKINFNLKNNKKSPIRTKLKLMNKILEKMNSNSLETGMFNLPLLSQSFNI